MHWEVLSLGSCVWTKGHVAPVASMSTLSGCLGVLEAVVMGADVGEEASAADRLITNLSSTFLFCTVKLPFEN